MMQILLLVFGDFLDSQGQVWINKVFGLSEIQNLGDIILII